MIGLLRKLALLALVAPLVVPPTPAEKSQKKIKVPRTTTSLEGGVFFKTDGDVPENTCFRIAGQLTAPEFFDHLERVDSENKTEFRSGEKVVTHFPSKLFLIVNVADFPCIWQMNVPAPRRYLTRGIVASLRWTFYWKQGVYLRPADNVTLISATIEPARAYDGFHELAGRYKWTFRLSIPSDGVPLTDSLVLILRTPDGRIAARVSGRL